MLIDVLQRVAADAGYNPKQQRDSLLKLLNNAAKEVYNRLECNSVFREVTLVVAPNKLVSLPAFVGPLRGVRQHTSDIPFNLQAMAQPRYSSITWQYRYKNWREVGESPVHTYVSAVGPLTLSIDEADDSVVLISGETANAKRFEESVTMDDVSKTTTASFGPTIYNIMSQSEREGDITVMDMNNNEIAVLYNNQPRTRYKMIDVSQVFWSQDTSDGGTLVDVLYKEPLPKFVNDSDLFPAGDTYNDAWYAMCMHLHYLPQEGRQDDATRFLLEAMAMLTSVKDNNELQLEKHLNFGRNKFYGLFRRRKWYPGAITHVDNPNT